MCGIAGFYTKEKIFDREGLEKMTHTIRHRGPDASGYHFDEKLNIGLGHRRLSILDLSEDANQPMYSKDQRYVIVYNGEVYNFKELSSKYNLSLSTTSDTEVLLKLFIQNGVNFVKELNGMFSIAIFDTQTQDLFLFRDRIGIKPLYYYLGEDTFAFSSELKSICTLLENKVTLQLEKQAIGEYLHLGYIPEPLSIYQNILKFPSGHYGVVSKNSLKPTLHAYWKTNDHIGSNYASLNFEQAKKQLDTLIQSSVNYRMISDVPLGTFLSGGTDSSLVTAMAQANSKDQIKTFSIGFKEAKFNESVHAAKVAKHLGTDHHEFILSEKDAIEQVDKLIDIYDEPYADSSAVPTLLVSQMARKEVTVTLSGDGGDELFFGYNMYSWAERLSNPLIKVLRKPISSVLKKGDNRKKRAATLFEYPSKNRISSHIFSQEQYLFSEEEVSELMKNNFLSSTNMNLSSLKRRLTPEEKQAYYDLNYYLKDDLLVKVDRASMHHALETRVPLLDHRVVEFALNLNPKFKIKDGIQKYLLKEVLYDYIPKEIMERPKWGFSIPLIKWLQTDLSYLIEKYLSTEVVQKHGIVNPRVVNSLIRQFRSGEDYLYNRLWSLIVLHKFLEKHNG